MRLRTTLQLASFFPIFLAALFSLALFAVHLTHAGAGNEVSPVSVTVATVMGLVALTTGWGFYRAGHRLVRQVGTLETMAERVKQGDLTPEGLPDIAAERADGVDGVAHVFSELVVELRGYVALIRAHEELKQQCAAAEAAANRLRQGAVQVSTALELLRRAEQGVMEQLIADDAVIPALRDDAAPPAPGMVSIQEALQTAMQLCRQQWGSDGMAPALTLDCLSAGPFDVQAERPALVQAFRAVLQNAADAMPQGGSVRIELGTDNHGTVTVAIADTGTGMSDVIQKRCIRPFFSTREHHLGMGLSLASRMVERFEGRLGIISEPGTGATVHMTFPPPRIKKESEDQAEIERGPFDILLVEDDAATRQTLAALLGLDQHRVTSVEDGAAAILALRKTDFDVVMTDRAMPIMTGDELATAVKARRRDTAVIMVTGMGGEMDRLHQKPADVDVVLTKPVLREDLKLGIARAMDAVAVAT